MIRGGASDSQSGRRGGSGQVLCHHHPTSIDGISRRPPSYLQDIQNNPILSKALSEDKRVDKLQDDLFKNENTKNQINAPKKEEQSEEDWLNSITPSNSRRP